MTLAQLLDPDPCARCGDPFCEPCPGCSACSGVLCLCEPPIRAATGFEGSCEACRAPVAIGQLVRLYADDVVVHERCPRERATA